MNRRWFKCLAPAAAACGVVAFAAWALSGRTDKVRLAEAYARLDADDPDWDTVGVVKAHNAAVPDDDVANATKVAFDALAWRRASWKSRQAAIGANEIPGLTWDNERLPRDEEFCSLHEAVVDSQAAVRVALAARRLPGGGLPFHVGTPDPTFGPSAQWLQVRELGGMLCDAATVDAHLGRGDEALRAADACLHLAAVTLASEPTALGQFARRAAATRAAYSVQQTLAWTEPSDALAGLQGALARAAAVDGVTPAFRGGRAFAMQVYDNVRSGDLPADFLDKWAGGTPVAARVNRHQRRLGGRTAVRDQAEVLRAWNALVAAARLDGPARRAACDEVVAGVGPGLPPLFSYVPWLVEGEDVSRSRLLAASVGLACERYRRQSGRWPVSLAEIPASILPAAPTDPLTGGPFAYRAVGDGAIVSSLARCGHVRTGTPDDDIEIFGFQLTAKFRLWNPDARRRPPRPDAEAVEPNLTAPGDAP